MLNEPNDITNSVSELVMAKLLYTVPACLGFSTTSGQNHIVGFVQRGVRSGFCGARLAEFSMLVEAAEDKLFHKIFNDANQVLFQLLPDQHDKLSYSLQKVTTIAF